MLDMIGVLTLGATAGTLFAAVLLSLPVRTEARLAIGAGVGAWVGLAIALAGSGAVAASPLLLLVLFMLPFGGAAIAATRAPSRSAVMAIPVPSIVSLNAMRVLGVLFLLLAVTGRMSGPFPYFAGIGDIVTGLFALPVARLAARNPSDSRVLSWNVFGMLDLVVAVALGLTSANGSRLQLIHAGVGSTAIGSLPWAFIPMVLVPIYLIGHVLVFAHARQARPARQSTLSGFAQA